MDYDQASMVGIRRASSSSSKERGKYVVRMNKSNRLDTVLGARVRGICKCGYTHKSDGKNVCVIVRKEGAWCAV